MFSKLPSPLILSALLVIAASSFAQAQTKGSKQVRTNLPLAEVKAKMARDPGRQPIPFHPFPMVDENGNPIPPDRTIQLPNGKSATAKQYFDSLNRIEKGLNGFGYTMRTADSKIKLTKPLISATMLSRQVAAYKNTQLKTEEKAPVPGPIFESVTGAKIAKHKGGMEHGPNALKKLARNNQLINPVGIAEALKSTTKISHADPVTKTSTKQKGQAASTSMHNSEYASLLMNDTVKYIKPWSFSLGDSDFGAYFNGSLDVEGKATTKGDSGLFSDSQSEFSANVSGKAGVNLISNAIDLVTYQAEFDGSDIKKKVHFGAGLFVVGVQVYSEDISKDVGYTFEDGWSIPYQQDTPEFTFPVFGPFVIKGKAGVMGEAGVKLDLILYASHITGEIHPYCKSKAYAQIAGSLDLGIASGEAGVRCDLTLLNDDLRVGTNVGLAFDPAKQSISLQEEFYCTNDIDALSGTVTLYATVYGLFGVKLKEWDWDWYSWPGFQDSSTLFSKKIDFPLIWH